MNQKGQGLTEYIVIVALVFIGAIGVITLFGDNLRDIVNTSADALSGNQNAARQQSEGRKGNFQKKLGDFGEDNTP